MDLNEIIVVKDEKPILYKIISYEEDRAILKGINYRIMRMASLDDVRVASENEIVYETNINDNYKRYSSKTQIRNKKSLLGTVLHIDGDKEYLEKCMNLYKEVGVYANGVAINEKDLAFEVPKILEQVIPDVVVITGHDIYNGEGKENLKNYKNTKYFSAAVRSIKKTGYDCIIIAGACQSNFEALIASGASYASSPARINVHTYDPAIIAIKICVTSFSEKVDFPEVLKFIEGGRDAFSGVQTYGKMRMLL